MSPRTCLRTLFPIVAIVIAAPAFSDEIHKCVEGAATTYQSMPCSKPKAERKFDADEAAVSYAPRPAGTVAKSAAREAPRKLAPWRNRKLELGMSDDEVLNMPGWGRPARIVRTRLTRGWQEVWIYGQPLMGSRQLSFTNARLSDVVDESAPQVARLTME